MENPFKWQGCASKRGWPHALIYSERIVLDQICSLIRDTAILSGNPAWSSLMTCMSFYVSSSVGVGRYFYHLPYFEIAMTIEDHGYL